MYEDIFEREDERDPNSKNANRGSNIDNTVGDGDGNNQQMNYQSLHGTDNPNNWQNAYGNSNYSNNQNPNSDVNPNNWQNAYGNGNPNYYGNQNPYSSNGPQYGPNGKKTGEGFGIASLILGIIALVTFCSCFNIPLAIAAIIFGIIQILSYERKGLAIAGIVTAALSILLFVASYTLLATSADFTEEVQESIDNGSFEEYLEEYSEEFEEDFH